MFYYFTDVFIREHWSEGPMRQLLQFPPARPEERTSNKDLKGESTREAVTWVLIKHLLWGEQRPGRQLWPGSLW